MSYEDDVREFHEKFDVPNPTSPQFPEEERAILRLDLIDEEYIEFLEALIEYDLTKVADAMADMVYVIIGAALEFGIPFDEVFQEVHRTNMLKENGGSREDGKILKPEGWEPPKIADILKRHQNGKLSQ